MFQLTWSTQEATKSKRLIDQTTLTIAKINYEAPEQSIDGMERKTTESAPMQNVEEPVTKKIEFSPIGNGHENTNNAPETIKYDSQTKRSSFTKKLAAMVGKKLREKEEVTTVTEKSKIFGTVSAITTKSNQEKEQVTEGTAGHQNERATESKVLLLSWVT